MNAIKEIASIVLLGLVIQVEASTRLHINVTHGETTKTVEVSPYNNIKCLVNEFFQELGESDYLNKYPKLTILDSRDHKLNIESTVQEARLNDNDTIHLVGFAIQQERIHINVQQGTTVERIEVSRSNNIEFLVNTFMQKTGQDTNLLNYPKLAVVDPYGDKLKLETTVEDAKLKFDQTIVLFPANASAKIRVNVQYDTITESFEVSPYKTIIDLVSTFLENIPKDELLAHGLMGRNPKLLFILHSNGNFLFLPSTIVEAELKNNDTISIRFYNT